MVLIIASIQMQLPNLINGNSNINFNKRIGKRA